MNLGPSTSQSPSKGATPSKITTPTKEATPSKVTTPTKGATPSKVTTPSKGATPSKITTPTKTTTAASEADNSFHQFFLLCRRLQKEPGYNAKTQIIKEYIERGSSGGI